MSEFDRVKAMLRQTARDGGVPGPVRYETAIWGAGRMVAQIEGTVMAERLEFAFPGGVRLTCAASSGRLMHLFGPAPKGLAGAAALFDRENLGADDAETLAELFVSLCETGTQFEVTRHPLEAAADPANTGVDPAEIAAALDLPVPSVTDDDLAAFLAAIGPSVLAAIQIDGDEAALIQGDGDAADFVIGWAETSLGALLAPEFPLLGSLETSGLLVFALPRTDGRHMVIAGKQGKLIVAIVTGSDVAPTVDAWRNISLTD